MVKKSTLRKAVLLASVVFVATIACAPMAFAADETAKSQSIGTSTGDGLRILGLSLGAALALAGGALGTARAQAAIGAAGTGAITEKPELFGRIFLLVVIPETLVIFGFVIAFMLMGYIKAT